MVVFGGRPTNTRPYFGIPAIAAISEILIAMAFQPISYGEASSVK